ncbi:MAG: hypothetical protein GTO14_07665 [Anaerolineales bacterium]|nr:hypothetical protein [Anaerolineales bacterium]
MPSLIDEFANYLGMHAWFVGGLIGIVAICLVLGIAIWKFRSSGIMTTILILGVAVINWQLFYWPVWAAVVTAIGFLWGLNRGR